MTIRVSPSGRTMRCWQANGVRVAIASRTIARVGLAIVGVDEGAACSRRWARSFRARRRGSRRGPRTSAFACSEARIPTLRGHAEARRNPASGVPSAIGRLPLALAAQTDGFRAARQPAPWRRSSAGWRGGTSPVGRVRPERRARRFEIERAELVAVKEAVGAGRLALAARLQTPPGEPDGADPFLGSILFLKHRGRLWHPAARFAGPLFANRVNRAEGRFRKPREKRPAGIALAYNHGHVQ